MWVIAATLLWLQFTVCKHALVSQVMKGDTMHIASEPFKPRPELVRLVESCLERIRPDPPHPTEWFRSYAMNHKTRIAFDINIVRENLPQNTRVLEFGSVPLLFTAALAECGYQVVGIDITPERFQSSIEKLGLTYSGAT
jgi:hypothetical protein